MAARDDAGVNRRSRGLERAFEILDFLRRHRGPMRPNEIASHIGAPRSTVYELVNLLLGNGVLEYHGGDGRVFLGKKLYFLGTAYAEHFDLVRESDALLTRLASETRETSQLCMLDGNKYTVIAIKEGARPFRISTDLGAPVPIPWTASGRLLLSHLSDEEILRFIPAEDFELPNGEWLSPQHFIGQVRQAVKDGYFTFDSIVDSFTHCFAVPVYQADRVCVATLCLVAPREDGLNNHDHYLRCLMAAAFELSQRLGFEGLKKADLP